LIGPLVLCLAVAIGFAGCANLEQPKVEPFYAVTNPPPKQELRWSNGKLPKSLDPALAASAPETDIVRAIYEGLTEIDPRSLREVPGVAESWESSDDLRVWTFHIRKDARWSNGDPVVARDFVDSWKRLKDLKGSAVNRHIFQNIVGMNLTDVKVDADSGETIDSLAPAEVPGTIDLPTVVPPAKNEKAMIKPPANSQAPLPTIPGSKPVLSESTFGVEAVDEATLRVTLELPDKDFARLVANPVFRPVHNGGANIDQTASPVANGAFRIVKTGDDGITLERAETYWNRPSVGLERVRFVPAVSAEAALIAYRKGEIDVVTNAVFAPLALKILSPYEDFRRTPFSALNFYEINTAAAPFNDRRVRAALATAIDRAKLTDGDLEGTNQPAYTLFPLGERRGEPMTFDAGKAKELLEKAGYSDGKGFPAIRLVVNRNDLQQRVARSVARMWKQNLNIDTTIIVKESSEIEAIRKSGDFDVLRRGVVLPTNDELVNIASVLGSAKKSPPIAADEAPQANADLNSSGPSDDLGQEAPDERPPALVNEEVKDLTISEDDAIFAVKVIPLYFPVSYSLVKPYIRGFETNGLDAISLKEVSIDNHWKPKASSQ